ncbi:MAG: cellobiose phosphorylase [Chloroflexi bacterium]|nr:cellobiose phosphorylase [Chloroflexota bacterium]
MTTSGTQVNIQSEELRPDGALEGANSLETAAQRAAQAHRSARVAPGEPLPLLQNLDEIDQLLQRVYHHFAQIAEEEFVISYAGEWLLDSFYMLQQALRLIDEGLPRHYYAELPKLTAPALHGQPRVYALAQTIVREAGSPLTMAQLIRFVAAYQEVTPLTMGELWALPLFLRAVIIEDVTLATSQLTGLEAEAQALLPISAPLPDGNDRQAFVANAIIGLRMLATQDWKDYFETVSRVERILRQDAAQVYARMDFETRNRYRETIEALAPDSGEDQERVARAAVELAEEAARRDGHAHDTPTRPDPAGDRTLHVGYYLLDTGRPALEARIGYRPSAGERLSRWVTRHTLALYLGGVAGLVTLSLLAVGAYTAAAGGSALAVIAAALLALLPASALAVHLVNTLVNRLVRPRTLPKLDFSEGIPPEYATMVVIPALLSDAAEVRALGQQLEQHFLQNPDRSLSFALLADFTDAPQPRMPDDEALADLARQVTEGLNHKYRHLEYAPFHLFLRRREWNPAEGVWMGRERKRGKLMEFNRLLLSDASDTTFNVRVGDPAILPQIRYVITLDADTMLPQGSAQRLVATLAHPLNRAEFAPDGQRVVAGYGVLQPRVEVKPLAASHSRFTQIFAGDTGVDLYTLAVSDVYQDLFGEGSYVGKGIYDVAAFERALAGRIPDNRLLSHDLFEGLHVRAGLVTDVMLLEDYPLHYLAQTRRLHRWIRGDWQLLPWLLPRVPQASGQRVPNYLTALDRWKIFDNLRRSLVRPGTLALLIAGWLVLPGAPLVWTLIALLLSAGPVITDLAGRITQIAGGAPWRSAARQFGIEAQRWALSWVFLPYEALVSLEAVVVTLHRLRTGRKLLQWTTAAHTLRLLSGQIRPGVVWQQMAAALALTSALGMLISALDPLALLVALPLLAMWTVSSQIAYTLSQPVVRRIPPLDEAQQRQLRTLARRTWLYFEEFVGPQDHWLAPDHYQKHPRGIVAHQTSPTNIGLMLLATLAAYDFGYIGLLELMLRLRFSFESLDRLERYRGHFLNWYNTETLAPLLPRYVSTVDSGNLAASLLTLRQGLAGLPERRVMRRQRWQGLLDTLGVLSELLDEAEARAAEPLALEPVHASIAQMERAIHAAQDDSADWPRLMLDLAGDGWRDFSAAWAAWMETGGRRLDPDTLGDLHTYLNRTQQHLFSMNRDLELLQPWALFLAQPPELFGAADLDPDLLDGWQALVEALPSELTFGEMIAGYDSGQAQLDQLRERLASAKPDERIPAALEWCDRLDDALDAARAGAHDLIAMFDDLGARAEAMFEAMEFGFLFHRQRRLFHIGYNVDTERLDNSFYDLLASEARIASLIVIATGEVPPNHWVHLGRPLTQVGGTQALLSWSGTMFEYLMPTLLMRDYEGTLLHQSSESAVRHQIVYGQQHGTPWGISESGYYTFDANLNYQYRAFGVPRLAFKRGQGADLVIAPYASVIALPFAPQAVMDNLSRFRALDMLGPYGLFEAIDYTTSRLPLGVESARVQEYMAHHQGMIVLALSNYLHDGAMIERFHADPRIQSVELLLQEQIPEQVEIQKPAPEALPLVEATEVRAISAPWPVPVDTPYPQAHYLSNGRYSVMITSAGGGYSQWEQVALTRWRPDTTLDNWGTWIYIREQASGALWSAAAQPMGLRSGTHTAQFHPHMAEFQRRNGDVSVLMEITVPPDDDLEIRRLTLTNHGEQPQRLLLCSYGEIVLAAQDGDQRHPAFNKLFIESEYVPESNLLLYGRRPRSAHEEPRYMAHALVLPPEQEAEAGAAVQYEGDRAPFLGRGGTFQAPAALLERDGGLTGTVGTTLDPIMALSCTVELAPYASVQVAYLTLASDSREKIMGWARTYRQWSAIERAFNHARYQGERELYQLGLDIAQVARIQTLLSGLLYPHPAFRADPALLAENTRAQPGLWAYGISGDYPIILLRISDEAELALVHELVQAHTYWRNRQIKVTLVILNQRDTGYNQELYDQVWRLIARSGSEIWLNRHDGIFILRADQISEPDRVLLAAAARIDLDGRRGPLAQQLESLRGQPPHLPPFVPARPAMPDEEPTPPLARPEGLRFDNGLGGFSSDGREYVIYLEPGAWTPAPWINVIANPEFGFTVSEAGSGFAWYINSGENRLTTWNNDPVADRPGEAIYLRDEETAEVWSPTPLPAPAPAPYLVRHGVGYTVFEHHSHGLKQQTTLFVAPDDPVKLVRVRLENTWQRPRRITVTYYVEWVLGTAKGVTQQYLIPTFDTESQTLLARNPYSIEFGRHYAFVTASQSFHGVTADRAEFLGRLGSLHHPAALDRIGLASTVQAGLDPCAVIQLHVDLPPGEAQEVTFLLGAGPDRAAALRVARTYQDPAAIEETWQAAQRFWRNTLDSVTIQTPDPAMNVIVPWLLYQALSCRIWGRSALYQSSGAFGFRDQLQDVMSVLHVHPTIAREHILRAARHQFEAGDVLHWWHPPSGRGVRTRFSDDLLWLPYVVAHYVQTTGDADILHERAPFLKGEPLKPEEEERYGFYESTEEDWPLYEHCRRALDRGYRTGAHDLPLMGAGDWNDGMSRVGIEGRGESVWMGWFLITTMTNFIPLAESMGDTAQASIYRERIEQLRAALEQHGWDGQWYRRAYYDDGTPLGSAQNQECRIDSLVQSWSVLSGAAESHRARQAMESVEEWLVREDDRLLLLFTPPFDDTPRDPGYIKGYPPGVRENGGQYTHAALWTVWAWAELGDGDRAGALFRLLNPVEHSDTPDKAARYTVEPYVVAADVYSIPPYVGHGGWTWYTGSSGWMYRLAVEAILGLRREGDHLRVEPCIPHNWPGFRASYRYGSTTYRIQVENPQGASGGMGEVTLDGEPVAGSRMPLHDDGREHLIRVRLGTAAASAED